MTVPVALPGPRSNRNRSGFIGLADDLAATDIILAVGDYTGGAEEDMFTLSAHGLADGAYVWLLHVTALGTVTGRVGTGFRVNVLSANTFQLTDKSGTVIENTADGSAWFLKGSHSTPDAVVQNVILPNLIVAAGDYTGGTTEDMFTPSSAYGLIGLYEADPLKLLYKSAAGVVTGISTGTTVYAKSVTASAFELAATAAGADIENTADGTAVFVRTS